MTTNRIAEPSAAGYVVNEDFQRSAHISLGGVILNGDSLLAKNWNTQPSAATPSRVGRLATHNITANSLLPGMVFYSDGWNDPAWNGAFTAIDVTANTVTAAISESASAAPGAGAFTPGYVLPQRNALGWFNWCEWIAGVTYGPISMASRGARTLSNIAAGFEAYVASADADVILQGGGTNDAINLTPISESDNALTYMIRRARELGKTMILQTVIPQRGKSAAVNGAILALNKMIRQKSAYYGLPLVDLYALTVEAASLDAQAALINADGVHQLAALSQLIPPVLNPILQARCPYERINLPVTTSDLLGTNASSNNLIDGFFAGTGGTEAGGADGDTATGWTLTNAGLTTCTGSKGAPGVGASQIVTIDGGATDAFTLSLASVHSLIQPGDVLQLAGKMTFALDIPVRCSVRVAMTPTGGISGQIRACQSYAAAEGLPASGTPFSLIFQSDPYTVPAGVTFSAANVQVACNIDATGSGDVTLQQFALRKLN